MDGKAKREKDMKVSMGSDHAGFQQKESLKAYLEGKGFDVADRGCYSEDRTDYPDYAALVANDVADGTADRGVLVCGTGIGMAMAADKVAGVRAANIITPQFAQLCREHNDCNVIALSSRFVELRVNEQILDEFFTAEFGGGRHVDRVAKIMALD